MTRVSAPLRVVAFLAGAALILAPAGALSFQAPSDRVFNVGVVRADGVLIPFAQFDRGTWRPFWTGVERSLDVDVPLRLEDVDEDWWRQEPPALDWTLRREGAAPARLKVTMPRVVYTPCSTQVALATDYKPAGMLPPPHQAPYPKLGLATTSSAVTIEPIPEVSPGDTDWRRVQRALDTRREFRNAENRALADMGWRHPVEPIDRNRTPIDLQKVWHVKDSRFFYIEAMRRYPDPDPPEGKPACELVTYVAGFLWEERSEELVPARVTALISYCHMEGATFLWPFGVIRDGAKQYWVFQSAGWTLEAYGITEPEPKTGRVRSHLSHVAGNCRW